MTSNRQTGGQLHNNCSFHSSLNVLVIGAGRPRNIFLGSQISVDGGGKKISKSGKDNLSWLYNAVMHKSSPRTVDNQPSKSWKFNSYMSHGPLGDSTWTLGMFYPGVVSYIAKYTILTDRQYR